jgi:hypothetical protein
MLKKQTLAVFALGALLAAPLVFADEQPAQAGFYGGVALRDAGAEAAGVNFGQLASTWGRYVSPVADDANAQRTLVFGGYRWTNDLAVEGSLSSAASYALRPFDASTRRGVGLSLVGSPDFASHTWNANVFTSWSLRNRFSFYGRLAMRRANRFRRTRSRRCRRAIRGGCVTASITASAFVMTSRRRWGCASSTRDSSASPASRWRGPCPIRIRCNSACSSGSSGTLRT